MVRDITTLLLVIIGLPGGLLVAYRLFSQPGLRQGLKNRYFIYLLLAALGIIFFGTAGAITRNNWIHFVAVMCSALFYYTLLCWLKLLITSKPAEHTPVVVRPIMALLLVTALLFQLLTFVLAGRDFELLSLAKPEEYTASFWLWLGAGVVDSTELGMCVIFMLELTRARSWQRGASFKHMANFLMIIGALILTSLIADLAGLIIGRAQGDALPAELCFTVRGAAITGLVLVVLLQMVFSQWFIMLFEKLATRQLTRRLQQKQWLYERSITLYNSSYRSSAYDFIDKMSLDWVNQSVDNSLMDIRVLLLRADIINKQGQAGEPNRASISFKRELEIWRHFLSGPEIAQEVLQKMAGLEASIAVPAPASVDETNPDQTSRHFVKLARQLEKYLRVTTNTTGEYQNA